MATTTNYSWSTPDNTAYVKDGASAIRTLGSSVDTTLYTALGFNYPGLRLIKKQTVGSGVASVAVTGAFSATYENYKIIYTGGAQSAAQGINLQLGSTTTGYSNVLIYANYTIATPAAVSQSNGSNFSFAGYGDTTSTFLEAELYQPFLSEVTYYKTTHIQPASTGAAGYNSGIQNSTTSFTGFTLLPSGVTLTGGTIYVYGYGIS